MWTRAIITGLLAASFLGGAEPSVDIASALVKSQSYTELSNNSKFASYVIDAENDEYVQVAIGEDMKTHFTRAATLRILKKMDVILILKTLPDGEEKWIVEYAPSG